MEIDDREEFWHFRKTGFLLDLVRHFDVFHRDQQHSNATVCLLFDQSENQNVNKQLLRV